MSDYEVPEYEVRPIPFDGIELRDGGEAVDFYIAKARRFGSVAEYREFRDANPARRKEMRKQRDNDTADSADSDEDRRRAYELLRITNG
jgi:hypothetical protein